MIGKIVIVLAVAVALLLGLSQSPHWSNTEFGTDSIPPWERSASMPAIIAPSSGVFDLTQVDIPKPGVGQILVKVQAAPVNPSDVYQASVATTYTGSAAFPRPLGLEGSGHVVASGGGPLAHLYSVLGVRVGFATFHGTWRRYALVDAMKALPLPSNVDYDGGASTIVNPLTVVAMLEIAREHGHRAIVHTAASSALGLMLLRAAPKYNVTIVCVVRGAKNAAALAEHSVPAGHIVRSDAPSFSEDLSAATAATGATLAFDAVAGDLTAKVYEAMPSHSATYVYGRLSGKPPSGSDFSTPTKAFTPGFLNKDWLDAGGPSRLLSAMYTLRSMLASELSTVYERRLGMEEALPLIREYAKHQKGGKVLLYPWK